MEVEQHHECLLNCFNLQLIEMSVTDLPCCSYDESDGDQRLQ